MLCKVDQLLPIFGVVVFSHFYLETVHKNTVEPNCHHSVFSFFYIYYSQLLNLGIRHSSTFKSWERSEATIFSCSLYTPKYFSCLLKISLLFNQEIYFVQTIFFLLKQDYFLVHSISARFSFTQLFYLRNILSYATFSFMQHFHLPNFFIYAIVPKYCLIISTLHTMVSKETKVC